MVESYLVEPVDAVRHQKVAVGEQPGHDAVFADAADDVVQIRVQHRFAAAERDNARAKPREMIDATEEFVGRYGR